MSQEVWFDLAGFWVHGSRWEPTVNRAGHPPVLLVHGLGANTLSWDCVGQDLSDALGTEVTAIDLPGFGRTRSPDQRAGLTAHREVVRAALGQLGPAVLAGNSMGGAISTSIAATHPDLVRGLVLVNAAYPRPSRNLDQLARTAKFAALTAERVATPLVAARARRLSPERLVDSTLAFVIAEPTRLDPELRDRFVALAAERRNHPEAARSYTESGGSLFRYLAGHMRDDVRSVTSPTLVLHGRRDRLVPVSFARHVAKTRPDWRYVEFADCGHAPQIELPEQFVATVSEWAEQELHGQATPA